MERKCLFVSTFVQSLGRSQLWSAACGAAFGDLLSFQSPRQATMHGVRAMAVAVKEEAGKTPLGLEVVETVEPNSRVMFLVFLYVSGFVALILF
jgi:hypothetical protein